MDGVVAQAILQGLRTVVGVVVAWDGQTTGGIGLVVGRDDIAARRVFFLRVVAEAVKAGLVGFVRIAVQNEVRLHPHWANWQAGRGPPADVAAGAGPNHVQPGGVNLAGGLTRLGQGISAVELVKGLQHRVFGFQKRPPHCDRHAVGGVLQVVLERAADDRAVQRALQRQLNGFATLDLDCFLAADQICPLALIPDLVGVLWIDFLCDQIEVVILEHCQRPAKLRVVAEHGGGQQCLKVTVELKAGRAQVGLKPDRGN